LKVHDAQFGNIGLEASRHWHVRGMIQICGKRGVVGQGNDNSVGHARGAIREIGATLEIPNRGNFADEFPASRKVPFNPVGRYIWLEA